MGRWDGETEDVGPGGCQIVTSRAVPPGGSVRLAIRCDAIHRTVSAAGKVVWSSGEAPARIGVGFERAAEKGSWFDALVAADPASARIVRNTLDRLPGRMFVFLGTPPESVIDFTPDELSLLRSVGQGVPLGRLARSLAPGFDRLRGSLFSLVQRRLLVFDPMRSPGLAAWGRALSSPEEAPPAAASPRAAPAVEPPERPAAAAPPSPAPELPPPLPRPPLTPAQRLYDEGMSLARTGLMPLAVERFRAALAHAPDDEKIWAALERLRPWV